MAGGQVTSTQDRIATLEARLHDGFTKIGEATAAGLDVPHWEARWVDVLREYERLEDEKAAHHAEVRQVVQAEMVGMPRKEIAA